MDADLEACLPAELRGAHITRVAAGLSGAGVYCVGEEHILKVASPGATSRDDWRARLEILRAAAEAGLAPRVVHVSERIVDRSFPMWFWNPQTRALALTSLGQTLRRVHELPARGAPAQ